MAGEKNEREVVRVENAQYTDGAGGCYTLGRWIDAYLFGIVDGLVYLCTQY